MTNPRRDRDFYRQAFTLALPIALQNFVISALNMADTVLIGGLGEAAIAAVGLANQVFFFFNLFIFGICSGASIFTSQFWGEKDVLNIRRVLGLSLLADVAVALLFFGAAFFLPGRIMSLLSKDREVIMMGARFLRIVSFSYVLTGVTFAYAFVLRGVGRPIYPMLTGGIAFLLNTILNYALIYGRYGLPRLGVAGSALATLTARAVEMLATLGLVYGLRLAAAGRTREMLDLSALFIRKFVRTVVPVVLNESIWALGTIMYIVVYSRMGRDVIAAYNIFATVDRLSMPLFFGMAQACAVMVGERIGACREDAAFIYAKRFALIGPAIGLLISGAILLGRGPDGPILSLFHVSADVKAMAGGFMGLYALAIPAKIFNLINIVGILRSGGDTRFSLFIDTFGLWFLAVPLAFLAGLVWRLPPYQVYLFTLVEEAFKCSLGVWRLRSKLWINNLVCAMRGVEARL